MNFGLKKKKKKKKKTKERKICNRWGQSVCGNT